MTEKAILSAIIFTVIYLVLNVAIAKLTIRIEEVIAYADNDDIPPSVFGYVFVFLISTTIMLNYTNWWITMIVVIILFGLFMAKRAFLIISYCTVSCCMFGILIILSMGGIPEHQAEQYIETESTNIVYDEDIKVKYLPQDTIYVEKVVLKEHYENYNYWEEDSYQYYYRIEENGGKTKSIAKEEIPASKVKIQYIKDNQKAMMKKICHTTYYKKEFFGIEVPMLKKSIETKYEFCIPEELLEIVEIK